MCRCYINLCLAATLPGYIRQSQVGAEVGGLVPVYMKHLMPSTLSSDDHPLNSKRLLWAAYDRMLAPLIPERTDDPDSVFMDGFRFVLMRENCIMVCAFGLGFVFEGEMRKRVATKPLSTQELHSSIVLAGLSRRAT